MAEDTLPAHVKRMVDEYDELKLRCIRIAEFLRGPDFADLNDVDKSLLSSQYGAMLQYRAFLKTRLWLAGVEDI